MRLHDALHAVREVGRTLNIDSDDEIAEAEDVDEETGERPVLKFGHIRLIGKWLDEVASRPDHAAVGVDYLLQPPPDPDHPLDDRERRILIKEAAMKHGFIAALTQLRPEDSSLFEVGVTYFDQHHNPQFATGWIVGRAD